MDILPDLRRFLGNDCSHLLQNEYTPYFHEGNLTYWEWKRSLTCNSSTWKGKDLKDCFKLDGAYTGKVENLHAHVNRNLQHANPNLHVL